MRVEEPDNVLYIIFKFAVASSLDYSGKLSTVPAYVVFQIFLEKCSSIEP